MSFPEALAGAGAGAIAALATCPLDVAKTVIQVQRVSKSHAAHHHHGRARFHGGVVSTLRELHAEGGIRSLYRGLGVTLGALVPNWAVYFTVYNRAQSYGRQQGFSDGPLLHMLSATAAGAVTDLAVNPLWMVKTRMQTVAVASRRSRQYTSSLDALRRIVGEEGFFALYKGLAPQLFGLVHVAIQFPLYEYIRRRIADQRPLDELSVAEVVVASSASKAVASVVAYPHEVLRARFQFQRDSSPTRYRGMADAVSRILKEEGYRGFYRGLSANLMRVVPAAAITITCYEKFILMFRARAQEPL